MSIQTPQRRYHFRKLRTRQTVYGTSQRPRLAVFRSSKHMYAQLIDDVAQRTLAAASTLDKAAFPKGSTVDAAKKLGEVLGQKAKSAGMISVVFDRGGRPYHGRIKALADGARGAGLQF